MFLAIFLEVFPGAHAGSVVDPVAPEKRPIESLLLTGQDTGEISTVEGIRGTRLRARNREDCGGPVHGDRGLICRPARPDHAGPSRDCRHADASFPQVLLLEREWPVEGIPLTAIIAGEDDEGVSLQVLVAESLKDAADSGIHALHHLAVDFSRAVIRRGRAWIGNRRGPIVRAFPRPVRCVVHQAKEERPCPRALDDFDGAIGKQLGQVAVDVDGFVAI